MRLFESLRDPFVTVCAPASEGASAVAKSLLESAGIAYQMRNDRTCDFFGWGRLSGGTNYVTGPVRIVVRPEDADVAREILSAVSEVRIGRLPLCFRVIAVLVLLAPLLIGVVVQVCDIWSAK